MGVYEQPMHASSQSSSGSEAAGITGCTCPLQEDRRQQHPSSRPARRQRLEGPDTAGLLRRPGNVTNSFVCSRVRGMAGPATLMIISGRGEST